MKKYICANCGFRNRIQVKSKKQNNGNIQRHCKNCEAPVYNSETVLQSMMRLYMLKN